MDFQSLARIRLRSGAGDGDPRDGFCVMQLASWISGDDRASDRPDCASPFLTSYAIALNDGAPHAQSRDALKPLALALSDSRDLWREAKRGRYLIVETAHRVMAPLLAAFGAAQASEDIALAKDLKALARAARAGEGALSNAPRSTGWANARAAMVHLALAASARGPRHLALRDGLFAALTALDDPDRAGALWAEALAVLEGAVALGRHGNPQAPAGRAAEARLAQLAAKPQAEKTMV